jgi:hypothetical protein
MWGCNVRYWHLADIEELPMDVRFWGKADIIHEKADIKKCPLMTQSGHIKVWPSKERGAVRAPYFSNIVCGHQKPLNKTPSSSAT